MLCSAAFRFHSCRSGPFRPVHCSSKRHILRKLMLVIIFQNPSTVLFPVAKMATKGHAFSSPVQIVQIDGLVSNNAIAQF